MTATDPHHGRPSTPRAAHGQVSDLFAPAPIQWGFRGDPYLWAEMAAVLSDTPLPPDGTQLDALIEATFARLAGVPMSSPERSVFVERHSHGGMSSGHVSLAFWRERALPLLRARLEAR